MVPIQSTADGWRLKGLPCSLGARQSKTFLLRDEGDNLNHQLSSPANTRASFTGSQPAQPIQPELQKLAFALCAAQEDRTKLIDAWLVHTGGMAEEVAVKALEGDTVRRVIA